MIKIGISAWTEKTLIASGWYPPEVRDAEGRLRYYASRFPLVEVDATYYALPSEHQVAVWCERTPRGFTMDLKAHALLTEHYTEPSRLPRDLLADLPSELRDKKRLYPKDVGEGFVREIARRFRALVEPLRASGRLGVVLFQFPVWFPISRAHEEAIARLHDVLPQLPLAVELRNATWLEPRNQDETLSLLRAHDLAYTCVDEPQGSPASLPPIAVATSRVALVRFHGRNRATWRRGAPSAAERFDYRYSTAELAEWVPRIDALARDADDVHVVLNNCHHDYAVRNAEELARLVAARRGLDEHRPGIQ